MENPEFEAWLRTVCFQKPTPEAYDLAKEAWEYIKPKQATTIIKREQIAKWLYENFAADHHKKVYTSWGIYPFKNIWYLAADELMKF